MTFQMAAVVIGRNEGERLEPSLRSVQNAGLPWSMWIQVLPMAVRRSRGSSAFTLWSLTRAGPFRRREVGTKGWTRRSGDGRKLNT